MNLFCIFLKKEYARDIQIFNGIGDHIVTDDEMDSEDGSIHFSCDYDDCWKDAEFDLLVGIYDALDASEAIEMAAKEKNLDARILGAIQLNQRKLTELPCQVGDTVYVKTTCEYVYSHYDQETNCFDCPFENDCNFEECEDGNERLFATKVESIFNNGYGWSCTLKGLSLEIPVSDFGRTVFLTYEEADEKWGINKKLQ